MAGNKFTAFLLYVSLFVAVVLLGNCADARPVAVSAALKQSVSGELPAGKPYSPAEKYVFGKLPRGPVHQSGPSPIINH
ncbi:hypothetical protein ACP275_12G137900 [Erythranthe tilingii]